MGSPSSTQTLAFVVLALLLCQGSKGWQTTDSGQEIQLSEWLKHLPQGNIKILLYGNDTQANATIQAIASNELRNISTTASHCHSKTSLHGVEIVCALESALNHTYFYSNRLSHDHENELLALYVAVPLFFLLIVATYSVLPALKKLIRKCFPSCISPDLPEEEEGDIATDEDGPGGLSPHTLKRLGKYTFNRTSSIVKKDKYCTTECSVCMDVLAEGDQVRVLPGCGHTFHVHCIDEWLEHHTTCPICRRDVRQALDEEEMGICLRLEVLESEDGEGEGKLVVVVVDSGTETSVSEDHPEQEGLQRTRSTWNSRAAAAIRFLWRTTSRRSGASPELESQSTLNARVTDSIRFLWNSDTRVRALSRELSMVRESAV